MSRYKGACKQCRYCNASQQGGNDAAPDGKVHKARAPAKAYQFLFQTHPLDLIWNLEFSFDHPCAINDATEPICKNSEEGAHPSDQKHWRDRKLYYVSNC